VSQFLRQFTAALAVFAVFALLAGAADARPGGGFGLGSRGTRTFSAPAATPTAPTAAPIQRSMTQPGSPTAPAAAPSGGFFGRPGGLFGGGLFGGLAAGFLGAGLFGLLFGHGMFGGLGGFSSIIGLLLQVGLIVIVGRLIWAWWQRQHKPAFAAGPVLRETEAYGQTAAGGFGSGAAVAVAPADFETFERLLGEIQTAFGAEDLAALRALVTPEMLSYFSEQLSENASRGVVNEVSGTKLLQGDLSEAWREGDVEFATVAMRFSLIDRTVDRNSGAVVAGSMSPSEITELWTFMRVRGGHWLLSAIQQPA
jgi:predicted lipid-binding transport protein (Tim44 family)